MLYLLFKNNACRIIAQWFTITVLRILSNSIFDLFSLQNILIFCVLNEIKSKKIQKYSKYWHSKVSKYYILNRNQYCQTLHKYSLILHLTPTCLNSFITNTLPLSLSHFGFLEVLLLTVRVIIEEFEIKLLLTISCE